VTGTKTPAEQAFLTISTAPASTTVLLQVLDLVGGAYPNAAGLAHHLGVIIERRHTGKRPRIDDGALVAEVLGLMARGWSRSAARWKVAKAAETAGFGNAATIYGRLDGRLRDLGR
jgi:hypothetical protein